MIMGRVPDENRATCNGDCEWCSLDCATALVPDDNYEIDDCED